MVITGIAGLTYLILTGTIIISAIREPFDAGFKIGTALLVIGPGCAIVAFLIGFAIVSFLTSSMNSPNLEVELVRVPDTFQACATHGLLNPADSRRDRCPICGGSLSDKPIFVRLEIERIAFVVTLAIVVAGLAISTTGGPNGEIMTVMPWESGATIWHWAVFILFLPLAAYGAAPFLLGLPKWKSYIEADKIASSKQLYKFNWRRFALEALLSVALVIGVALTLAIISIIRFTFYSATEAIHR